MTDTIMYLLKLTFFLIFLFCLMKMNSSEKIDKLSFRAVVFGGMASFMTGVEMITNSESPWQFLFFESQASDWSNAFFGGAGMIIVLLIIYTYVYEIVRETNKNKHE